MTLLERQLEQYCEFVDELHGPIAPTDMVYRPSETLATPRRGNGGWAAIGAAAVVIVAFGGVAVLSMLQSESPVSDTVPAVEIPITAVPTTTAQDDAPVSTTVPEATATAQPTVPSAAAVPAIQPFIVTGELDVDWILPTGRTPDSIDSYESGEYLKVGEGGVYRSNNGIAWSFERLPAGPDWVSHDGEWAAFYQGYYVGVLVRMTDGEWVPVERPSQADQSGSWVWETASVAVSGDILIVPGGPGQLGPRGEHGPDPRSIWRIEADGPWELIGQSFGDTYAGDRTIEENPSGGFLYDNPTDGNSYISDNGSEWKIGGRTEVQVWNDGDLFPGLEYSFRGSPDDIQVWTSPDGIIWTFEFALPPTTDRNWDNGWGVDLHRTNRGIVAMRSNRESESSPQDPAVEF